MKLQRNPDKCFFFTVMFFMMVLAPIAGGVDGQIWLQPYTPLFQFFVGAISICLGPWLIGTALKARDSEETVTVWKRSWPVTFALGILSPLGGMAMLWRLFGK